MVLISHQNRFIYLKTHKTAGTTVEMCLEPLCTPPGHVVTEETPEIVTPYGIVGSRKFARKRPWPWQKYWHNHMTAADVKRQADRSAWDQYAKIAAVRNPFARMVSMFNWKVSNARLAAPADFSQTREAFRAFVGTETWADDRDTVFVGDDYVINHAIRYEVLERDLKRIFEAVGAGGRFGSLPLTKPSASLRQGHDVAEYFDETSAGIVRKRMDWVFSRYGYSASPEDSGREPAN